MLTKEGEITNILITNDQEDDALPFQKSAEQGETSFGPADEPEILVVNLPTKFDIELFSGESRVIAADYICFICEGVYYNSVIDDCGHIFCSKCLEEHLRVNNNKCPIEPRNYVCRITKVDFIKSILDKQAVKCTNFIKGCSWAGKFSELMAHLTNNCMKQNVKCVFEDCENNVERENLNEHIKECEFRSVACSYCNLKVKWHMMNEHSEICDSHPVSCLQNCGIEMMRKAQELHIQKECPNTEIDCSYSKVGCTAKPKRGVINDHYKEHQIPHTLLFLGKYEEAKAESNKYFGQINDIQIKLDFLLKKKELELLQNKSPLYGNLANQKYSETAYSNNKKANKGLGNSSNQASLLTSKLVLPMKESEFLGIEESKEDYDRIYISDDSSKPCSKIKKSRIVTRYMSDGLKITGPNRVSVSVTNNDHKFIFTNFALTQCDLSSWKVKVISASGWIGIGVSVRNIVLENSKKFIIKKEGSEFSNNGCFMISSNGFLWNANNTSQNNFGTNFTFSSGSIIKVTYNSNKEVLKFENGSQVVATLSKVGLSSLVHMLVPTVILMNKGDEIEFDF